MTTPTTTATVSATLITMLFNKVNKDGVTAVKTATAPNAKAGRKILRDNSFTIKNFFRFQNVWAQTEPMLMEHFGLGPEEYAHCTIQKPGEDAPVKDAEVALTAEVPPVEPAVKKGKKSRKGANGNIPETDVVPMAQVLEAAKAAYVKGKADKAAARAAREAAELTTQANTTLDNLADTLQEKRDGLGINPEAVAEKAHEQSMTDAEAQAEELEAKSRSLEAAANA